MKKNIYYIMAIGVFILVLSGSAYAYFLSSASEKDKIVGNSANPSLTVDVEEITKTESLLIPMDKLVLDKAISHSPQCIDDNGNEVCDIYKITVTNTGDASLYSTVSITLNGSTLPNLKWREVNSDSLKDNVMDYGLGKNNLVMDDVIGIGKNKVYYIMVYINDIGSVQSDNGVYSGVVDVNGATTELNNRAYATLTRLGLEVDTTHTPDFSGMSGESENTTTRAGDLPTYDGTNGVYSAEDDLGKSYYFRGAVENNYVKFANLFWRIIRINGDGSVRMIYAGTSAHENGYDDSSTSDMNIGKSVYNNTIEPVVATGVKNTRGKVSNKFLDNKDVNVKAIPLLVSDADTDNGLVGYMYGNFDKLKANNDGGIIDGSGSISYTEAHSNINSSTVKTMVDNWYKDNLSTYSSYIEDSVYCNDRSITKIKDEYEGNGYGTQNTTYSGYNRIGFFKPNLKCANLNDRFTVSSDNGNGVLTYPIGLITSDEVVYAGAGQGWNKTYYLYNGNIIYWTMSPGVNKRQDYVDGIVGSSAKVNAFSGAIDSMNVNTIMYDIYVRPVISLKVSAISGGTGTASDPFVVR